jgi:molecular chaperone IbpA
MGKPLSFINDALRDFDKFFVGYDFDQIAKTHSDLTKNIPNYPPYNIKKIGDVNYVIEIAVAGFSSSEIDVELDGDRLTVKGNAKSDQSDDYLFKGIGMRDFTRTFALNDHVEVKSAELVNGMLKIDLERIIPEHKKPKKIAVVDQSIKSAPQLLQEHIG